MRRHQRQISALAQGFKIDKEKLQRRRKTKLQITITLGTPLVLPFFVYRFIWISSWLSRTLQHIFRTHKKKLLKKKIAYLRKHQTQFCHAISYFHRMTEAQQYNLPRRRTFWAMHLEEVQSKPFSENRRVFKEQTAEEWQRETTKI